MTKIVKGAGRGRYSANKAKHDQRTPFGGGRDVHAEHTQALLEAAAAKPNFAQLANESVWDIFEWREAWDILGHPPLWPTVLELCKTGVHTPTSAAGALRAQA